MIVDTRVCAVVAALLACTTPAAPTAPATLGPACLALHQTYEQLGAPRAVVAAGRARGVLVLHAGDARPRAAAALLAAAARHVLRYSGLRLRRAASLCRVQARCRYSDEDTDGTSDLDLAIIPAIEWNERSATEDGCEMTAAARCPSGARLQVAGAGAGDAPAPAAPTVRAADVDELRSYAPPLLNLFYRFSPTHKDLQAIFNNYTHLNDIEEASCAWASANPSKFTSWCDINVKPKYLIKICLCKGDPDNKQYTNTMRETFKTIYNKEHESFDIDVYLLEIDCKDEYSLMKEFISQMQITSGRRLAGVVSAGAGGAVAGARAAAALRGALLLAAPPPPRATLGPHALAAAPPHALLARALHHFTAACAFTRLAVLSENTTFAEEFYEAIKSNSTLILRDFIIKEDASVTLRTLIEVNARIIFVNGGHDTAMSVLCAASHLGIIYDAAYVWILREWRAEDVRCENVTIPREKLNHFTISFAWRGAGGGQDDAVARNKEGAWDAGGSLRLRRRLARLWPARAWPPLASALADCLVLLLHGLRTFLQNQPQRRYDIHSQNTTTYFWTTLNKQPLQGVIQNLTYENYALSNPLVFVNRWHGQQNEQVAVWQIDKEQVFVHWQLPFFGKDPPSDGAKFCLIVGTNDDFLPRCHDIPFFTALIALLACIPAIYLARRARLEHLSKRERSLTARLLSRNKRTAKLLADHLVDRSALVLGRELGAGRFGHVRLAALRLPGQPRLTVAAKALREDATSAQEREFLNEACILATLQHEHIVRLSGVCATGGPILVLMEHAFFGDLLAYLQERRHLAEQTNDTNDREKEARYVSAPALTKLAREAAVALSYLAMQRVVHRDVRAANCLVDARRSLKLADFGLARRVDEAGAGATDEYLCRRRGLFPVLWMAPESLERGVFTAASDAWALGVLLLELLTLGARPYACWPPLRVLRYVAAGGRPPTPADLAPAARRLLHGCWRHAPDERYTAATVADALTSDMLQPALQPIDLPDDELGGRERAQE